MAYSFSISLIVFAIICRNCIYVSLINPLVLNRFLGVVFVTNRLHISFAFLLQSLGCSEDLVEVGLVNEDCVFYEATLNSRGNDCRLFLKQMITFVFFVSLCFLQ